MHSVLQLSNLKFIIKILPKFANLLLHAIIFFLDFAEMLLFTEMLAEFAEIIPILAQTPKTYRPSTGGCAAKYL